MEWCTAILISCVDIGTDRDDFLHLVYVTLGSQFVQQSVTMSFPGIDIRADSDEESDYFCVPVPDRLV